MNRPSEARILIVDDDEVILGLLEHVLHGAGFGAVVSTPDPREVELLYQAYAPDLVLLDLELPHRGGLEVLGVLRRIAAHELFLPVIVMSGDISGDTRQRIWAHGAQAMIEKPFETAELLTRIRNLAELRFRCRRLELENARLTRELAERARGGAGGDGGEAPGGPLADAAD